MNLFTMHESYMKPIWEGGLITDETVFPLRGKDETGPFSVRLLNPIERILSVRTATHDTEFEEGRDYEVRDGELYIPADTRIPVIYHDRFSEPATRKHYAHTDGGFLFFGVRNDLHKLQLAVTYESAANSFDGHYRPAADKALSGVRAKLTAGEVLKLAFFGDSITFGCNASGLYDDIPPHMPIYPRLVAETLSGRGYHIHYYNPSVGGKATPWGVEVAAKKFENFAPDLAVIAFGMNDGSGMLPVEDYIGNTRKIIHTIREKSPDSAFILVATTLPNPLAQGFFGLQPDYEAPLAVLADEEGAAFLNMTELHRTMLTRKEFHHMTGNNINHPSDFLARVYAQGILALIGR